MAATFGNLDLESLGVVGEPSVEYAKFETKVSEPDGYDGGVLANFRRGATKIKFNLALDGDRAALVAKMNQLAAELSKGQQELVLPNMTQGFHFDASANCVLQPVEYVDGFVLPLEFTVPEGCAKRVQVYEASTDYPTETPISNDSMYDMRLVVSGETVEPGTVAHAGTFLASFSMWTSPLGHELENVMIGLPRSVDQIEPGWKFSYDTDTYGVESNANLSYLNPFDLSTPVGPIPPGETRIMFASLPIGHTGDYLPSLTVEAWSTVVW